MSKLHGFVLVSGMRCMDETSKLYEHHDREQGDWLLYESKLDRA